MTLRVHQKKKKKMSRKMTLLKESKAYLGSQTHTLLSMKGNAFKSDHLNITDKGGQKKRMGTERGRNR